MLWFFAYIALLRLTWRRWRAVRGTRTMAEHIHGAAALVLVGIGLTMIVDNPLHRAGADGAHGHPARDVARAAVGKGGAGLRDRTRAGRGTGGGRGLAGRVNVLVLHSRYSTGPSSGENRVVDR